MVLSEFDWGLILAVFGLVSTLGGLAVAIISFFLKRTMNNVDSHGKDIQDIKENYASNESLNKTQIQINEALEKVQTQMTSHHKDIHDIKLTYVTKDELKELKSELRDDYKKLVDDVADIKDNCIRKDDFHRTLADLTRTVNNMWEFMIKEKGGHGNGR